VVGGGPYSLLKDVGSFTDVLQAGKHLAVFVLVVIVFDFAFRGV
jgi:hypothetical protein